MAGALRDLGITAMVLLAVATSVAGPAAAQPPADPDARRAALGAVSRACQADYLRFCPADANTVPSARDEVICLRAMRTDLSLGCRHAVNAATQ